MQAASCCKLSGYMLNTADTSNAAVHLFGIYHLHGLFFHWGYSEIRLSLQTHPAYIPALSPSVRVSVAVRGHPNPPMGRSVNWAQHIRISPASSCTGAVGAISEIVASASCSKCKLLSQ